MLFPGEGLSPLSRSCNRFSLLRFTSEYGQPTKLWQRNKKEKGQWKLYSHTVFPTTGTEIRHKTRKNEATNSQEVLLPSSRCEKAGDYMAELKTKFMQSKNHHTEQEELILCNLQTGTFHESMEFCNFQSEKFKALYYIINYQVFWPPTWDCFLALKIIYLRKSFLFQEHTRNQKTEHKTWATPPHFNILPMPSPLQLPPFMLLLGILFHK